MKVFIKCQKSGKFRPNPSDFKCLSISCLYPANLLNTIQTVVSGTNVNNSWLIGTSIKYSCKKGYKTIEMEDNQVTELVAKIHEDKFVIGFQQVVKCLANGRWYPKISSLKPCKAITCPVLPQIKFAKVVQFINDTNGIHAPGAGVSFLPPHPYH